MSKVIRCDICDTKREVEWKYRKRFRLFRIKCAGDENTGGCWEEELDICDECMSKFNTFVKKNLTAKANQ